MIFIREIDDNFQIIELSLSMESMNDRTTGVNFSNKVLSAFQKLNIDFNKIVSVTTDGCISMTGPKKGLKNLSSKTIAEMLPRNKLIFLHCIIHKEQLCKKTMNFDSLLNR